MFAFFVLLAVSVSKNITGSVSFLQEAKMDNPHIEGQTNKHYTHWLFTKAVSCSLIFEILVPCNSTKVLKIDKLFVFVLMLYNVCKVEGT